MATQNEFAEHFKNRTEAETKKKEAIDAEFKRRDKCFADFVEAVNTVVIPAFQEKQTELRKYGLNVAIDPRNLKHPMNPSVSFLTSTSEMKSSGVDSREQLFYAFDASANGVQARFRTEENEAVKTKNMELSDLTKETVEPLIRDFFMKCYPEDRV